MTSSRDRLLLGAEEGVAVEQLAAMGNRHGLIAGATGTGKTVTLQVLAEGFSRIGVPVFATDIKGDLSGVCRPAAPHPEVDRRLAAISVPDYAPSGAPTLFWDALARPGRSTGRHGHPLRTTISEMGPLVLGNLLELNETQTGVLYAAFAVADDEGLLLLDLKDLRSMLGWVGDNAKTLRARYGNIAGASVGAIQRRLLVLEEQGGDLFFGEPALDIRDLMQRDFSGRGVISLLDSTRLTQTSPRLYAAVLMWLLSELFEELPEVGNPDRPVLVLVFDEAHLLFHGMPKSLLEKIEQVVRLIRSKGVGVFFVTQDPADVPEGVAGQLGLKIQHALRAFTPKDRKALREVARSFRTRAGLDVEETIPALETGEALVSVLGARGAPEVPRRTLIVPPRSRIGAITAAQREEMLKNSPMAGRYDAPVDRESAYEMLEARAARAIAEAAEQAEIEAKEARARERDAPRRRRGRQSVGEAMLTSAARSVGRSLGSRLVRGLLGSLLR